MSLLRDGPGCPWPEGVTPGEVQDALSVTIQRIFSFFSRPYELFVVGTF